MVKREGIVSEQYQTHMLPLPAPRPHLLPSAGLYSNHSLLKPILTQLKNTQTQKRFGTRTSKNSGLSRQEVQGVDSQPVHTRSVCRALAECSQLHRPTWPLKSSCEFTPGATNAFQKRISVKPHIATTLVAAGRIVLAGSQ